MATPFHENWPTQLRKGLLELALLRALRQQRLYGLELVRLLGEVEGLVVGEGTIYPILSRLKREGFVKPTLEESPDGPARKYYVLTARGRNQLLAMESYWQVLRDGVDKLEGRS